MSILVHCLGPELGGRLNLGGVWVWAGRRVAARRRDRVAVMRGWGMGWLSGCVRESTGVGVGLFLLFGVLPTNGQRSYPS